MIYMRARRYDPATGQFITSDPIGHASGETNLYRYAGGDPTNVVDPSGLLGVPSLADVSNFAAGFGDTASFGITRNIRSALGVDNVDYCSSAYGYGGNTATGVELATGVAAVAKVAGKIGYRNLGRRLAEETGSVGGGRLTGKQSRQTLEYLGVDTRRVVGSAKRGEPVYRLPDGRVITRDYDGHKGSAFKIARRVEDLYSDATRGDSYSVGPDGGLVRVGK